MSGLCWQRKPAMSESADCTESAWSVHTRGCWDILESKISLISALVIYSMLMQAPKALGRRQGRREQRAQAAQECWQGSACWAARPAAQQRCAAAAGSFAAAPRIR